MQRPSHILCRVMCPTSQIFLLVVAEAGSLQAVGVAHLGLCVFHYMRARQASSSPISQMSKLRLRSQVAEPGFKQSRYSQGQFQGFLQPYRCRCAAVTVPKVPPGNIGSKQT